MPKKQNLRKVLVIGSGPIIIGQAAEFDYAGTQACRTLTEQGLEVVLINSNPATIMTDSHVADRVYIEPLTPEYVEQVIAKERPDGLLPTLGGQVGLNLAVEVAKRGVLEKYGVELLGTPLSAIEKAEDRELFKEAMRQIGQPVPDSAIVTSCEQALAFASGIGYPLIVRPAYTLGGTGGGIVNNDDELREITRRGLQASLIGQVLIERSVAGWKEIEYEVLRDSCDNCIAVCNMENFDPVGIHTGDSIVVAPSQTLTDKEYYLLRRAAFAIVSSLGIEGGCNVQFALDVASSRYYVIEVNPRVSRSSALASKATGYPIAKVAAQIAIGYHLDEIVNAVTKKTTACFEPSLDYVVVKFPRWPFDKFNLADRSLGTQMKATGEVMAVDRSFEGALLKAVRSLEIGLQSLSQPAIAAVSDVDLETMLAAASDERLFAIAEGLRRGWPVNKIVAITKIERFFVEKIANIVIVETSLYNEPLTPALLRSAKQIGFTDKSIAAMTGQTVEAVGLLRKQLSLLPVYKTVDTCAAEFAAETPYYYSTYAQEDEAEVSACRKVVVLGAGPIRIGQGIEFDYCSVQSVLALQECGINAIIINNNPETVSTDFDIANRLYFEPLTLEDVLHIIGKEQPEGVIVQFGGQTAISLAEPLAQHGIRIVGTSVEDIDVAEDREKFDALLTKLGLQRPAGFGVTDVESALAKASVIGYPVIVRPSYVLGGRAMQIVDNNEELVEYAKRAFSAAPGHPVLIDRYIAGIEVEVDAVCDGQQVFIPGIMEHIERAGIHSGDSIAVYPPQRLTSASQKKIVDYTEKLALGLNIKGLINIQFVVADGEVYVLEVNPRSSRTVPFISKATNVPLVKIATKVALGKTLAANGVTAGLLAPRPYVAVKAPVFSFAKLPQVDALLGPEMKSTGEVMGLDACYTGAMYKALTAAGWRLPPNGIVLFNAAGKNLAEAAATARSLVDLGYQIAAAGQTASYFAECNVPLAIVIAAADSCNEISRLLQAGTIGLVVSTLIGTAGDSIRRQAIQCGVPCLTSLDTANVVAKVLAQLDQQQFTTVTALQDYAAV